MLGSRAPHRGARHFGAGRRAALLAIASGSFLASNGAYGSEAEYINNESPVENSVLDVRDIIGRELAPAEKKAREAVFRLPDDLAPFLRDTSLYLKPRTYYFNRQRDETTDSQAWAAGGALEYRSGRWRDRLSVGATLYTSQKLYGPDDKPGSGLLKPIQQGFTVLGEAYLDVRVTEDTHLRLFRQSMNLPYINRTDGRMVPNTFEAYNFVNSDNPNYNYIVGHVEKIKRRASDDFVYMSEAAGADGTSEGLSMAGARLELSDAVNIGAINQYSWDAFNTLFAEANAAWIVEGDLAVRFSGQFTDQRSVGDELIGSFDTYNVSLRAAASFGGAVLTFAFTHTDEGARIRNPYGGYPGYTSLMLRNFNRAGEDAWLIGLSYDFANAGLPGLSGFVNYASGNTPESGAAASPDEDELDLTLDYRPPKGLFEDFWLRARTAFLEQHGAGADDVTDFRLILNYTVPLL
jgi:hypothetical protein